MTTLALRKSQLEARLADLSVRLKGIDAELDSHNDQDWEELATEREGDEGGGSKGDAFRHEGPPRWLLDE